MSKRMMSHRMADAVVRWLSIAALTLGAMAAVPAQAAIYVGDWDPAFGSDFPDLGWRGEATFLVPDACLATDGWVLNGNACSGFGMQLLSAEVEFYRLSDPSNPAFHETLQFDVASSAVLAMELDDGLLTGVLGSFLYSRPSTLPLAGGPYTDFVLFFEGDLARLFYVSTPPDGHPTAGFSERHPPDGSPFITFRTVPEPGVIGMFAAALLGLALLRGARRVRSPSR